MRGEGKRMGPLCVCLLKVKVRCCSVFGFLDEIDHISGFFHKFVQLLFLIYFLINFNGIFR